MASLEGRFTSESIGLDATFRLTAFSTYKGCSCKVPQAKLRELLVGIGDETIGMDCSIVATRFPELFQVSTTDFFFPLVEDPYLQGQIACSNVLSDLYALGVYHCDNILMLLGVSVAMKPEEADIVTRLMMKGFNDQALAGLTKVTGGQSVKNEWPLIGGVAMVTAQESDFIRPESAVAGDVLVLTKPIGTQVAVNLHQWLDSKPQSWQRFDLDNVISKERVYAAFDKACESMKRLNRNGAILMHKYQAHGATDVTGFGLYGHAENLARNQKAKVDFVIDLLPVIADTPLIAGHTKLWDLLGGKSAETSGGLLVALPAEQAQSFIDELQALDGKPAWIIGRVVDGSNTCIFSSEIKVLEI